ncbi:MAG: mechanosensitive ion channel family protein [Phycisphaerales bacterium]|nr:mechanosensitive ion channel family protein [Phycisphaerales bacterium]NNM27170.1 mechanosensitive ion channel family protein [Phycisphaerales bacterium]
MKDVPREIDINPEAAVETIDSWLDSAVKLAPNIGVALIVLVVFIVAAIITRRVVMRFAKKQDRTNLGEMLGGFAKWVMIAAGVLLASTIVFPTLEPGDLVAGLGVSSVAIGFAFKDILQNWLAGLLILIRQPFEVGDQIEVDDYEGTVQHIETRATIVRTYDGERAVIPNSTVYTNPILVKTSHDKRRSQYDIGIGYGDDIDAACEVIRGVLEGIDGIESDPAPQTLPWDLAASWVTIRARWWTDPRRSDVVQTRAAVIREVKKALDDARIDMPYETSVRLLHDQTETRDGDRGRQREGWPAPENGHTTPRHEAAERPNETASTTSSRES